jgi:hypothetical protein
MIQSCASRTNGKPSRQTQHVLMYYCTNLLIGDPVVFCAVRSPRSEVRAIVCVHQKIRSGLYYSYQQTTQYIGMYVNKNGLLKKASYDTMGTYRRIEQYAAGQTSHKDRNKMWRQLHHSTMANAAALYDCVS